MKYIASKDQGPLVMFSVPFDSTSSGFPGSKFAGSRIREASVMLEEFSPLWVSSLEDVPFADVGEIEVFPDTTQTVEKIFNFCKSILDNNQSFLMIGGEHTVTLGAVKACIEKFGKIRVIHLDAHADLRDEFEGTKVNHATVMRRVWEEGAVLFQLGIRSFSQEEWDFVKKNKTLFGFADSIPSDLPIYLSIDLDVFDPAVFPGTGTPEPGGIFWDDFARFVKSIPWGKVVAMDVVEFCPLVEDKVSAVLAAKVIRELILGWFSARLSR